MNKIDEIETLQQMIEKLRSTPIRGPLLPALQHLEEAKFWLEKCQETTNKEILK